MDWAGLVRPDWLGSMEADRPRGLAVEDDDSLRLRRPSASNYPPEAASTIGADAAGRRPQSPRSANESRMKAVNERLPLELGISGAGASCQTRQNRQMSRTTGQSPEKSTGPNFLQARILQDNHDAETFHKLCQALRTEEGERRCFVG